MKRTHYLIEEAIHGESWLLSANKITCETIGEMSDGVKVWRDIESGNYYGLLRMLGKYYFYKF